MSAPEIIMSPLCREIVEDGTKLQVDIYRGVDESGWILEVIDEENPSTATQTHPSSKTFTDTSYRR